MKIIFAASILILIFCSSCRFGEYLIYDDMGYHHRNYKGIGYSEIRIDDNVYNVSYRAKTNAAESMARDYALLRAAELTLEADLNFFTIIEENYTGEEFEVYIPGSSSTKKDIKKVDSTQTIITITERNEPEKVRYNSIPEYNYLVQLHSLRPKDFPGIVYNAQYVYESIIKKYNITFPPETEETLSGK